MTVRTSRTGVIHGICTYAFGCKGAGRSFAKSNVVNPLRENPMSGRIFAFIAIVYGMMSVAVASNEALHETVTGE